jgi:uncharacterized protein (TIGR02444 family)
MGLWDETLEAYARPGAPEACLALQDAHGQNVPFLLWAVWARAADPVLLTRAADLARRWEALTLAPIRAVRRGLKPGFAGVEASGREALRDAVKAVELRAERVLMEALEAMTEERGGGHALAALAAASAAWGNPAPGDALAALAAALG